MTRSPVEARRATPEDLDDLVLLWSHAREDLGRQGRLISPPPSEQFRARLAEALGGSESIILIGRYEGAAAGFAVLRLSPVVIADPEAVHVDQLFVLAEQRRRGVARALLLLTASIAERSGAEQVLVGAPPSAREAHRFLARLGFSPLVVRRVVGTAALRRRLAGEGQRRGLEELLSRRRSLRARSLRAGWGGRPAAADEDDPGDPPEPCGDAGPGRGDCLDHGPVAGTASLDITVRHLDLSEHGAAASGPGDGPSIGTGPSATAPPSAPAAGAAPPAGTGVPGAVPGRRRGRQRA